MHNKFTSHELEIILSAINDRLGKGIRIQSGADVMHLQSCANIAQKVMHLKTEAENERIKAREEIARQKREAKEVAEIAAENIAAAGAVINAPMFTVDIETGRKVAETWGGELTATEILARAELEGEQEIEINITGFTCTTNSVEGGAV